MTARPHLHNPVDCLKILLLRPILPLLLLLLFISIINGSLLFLCPWQEEKSRKSLMRSSHNWAMTAGSGVASQGEC